MKNARGATTPAIQVDGSWDTGPTVDRSEDGYGRTAETSRRLCAQWRHMHLVEDIPCSVIAREDGRDTETVARHCRGGCEHPMSPEQKEALEYNRTRCENMRYSL